tara:strand:+ start:2955 stop:3923 length:969 start_codon:yes stop_codon:yes gene_type:complete
MPRNALDHTQLRPTALEDFVGQEQIKPLVQALLDGPGVLPHSLLTGPAGHGKTTLAGIIARELGLPLTEIAGPSIRKQDDLVEPLTTARGVVFIDEVHRLTSPVQEVLFPALEDGKVAYRTGRDILMLGLQPGLIILAATTNPGSLLKPLLDRFVLQLRFQSYKKSEISELVSKAADRGKVPIDDEALEVIANRSRRNPRQSNHILVIASLLLPKESEVITGSHIEMTLEHLGVDGQGLTVDDHRLLVCLATTFKGEPVGLNVLALAARLEVEYVMSQVEPYLLDLGFVERGTRGRKITKEGWEHLKVIGDAKVSELASPVG